MPQKKIQTREEVLTKFGTRLKKLREKKGLSGAELGRMVDMERQTINRFETGRANPSLIIIKKLCTALGVKVEEFFKGFK